MTPQYIETYIARSGDHSFADAQVQDLEEPVMTHTLRLNQHRALDVRVRAPSSKNYNRGRGCYRLELDAASTSGTQWLQFDGASIVADVWLNGQKLGQHKGAFTAFRFDVTGKLTGQKNVLLVKTDNSAPTAN